MPKIAREMSALEVKRLVAPGLHFVGGVAGLALQVTPTGARSWILRAVIAGRRRDMGLGNFPGVTLAVAREKAREHRETIRGGVDPIDRQRAARSALQAAAAAALTFDQCAERYVAAHESAWKNAKHAQQWRNTLRQYASPVMGDLLVRDIETAHVLAVLEPIWRTKTETATRLRGRVELVLDWATARNYREGLNPARWRGHLDKLLPSPNKVAKVEHHAALPVDELPDFMEKLRLAAGTGAMALHFAILTAARSGEVRGARRSEIDMEARLWTIPAARMKAGREHRVPLSEEAMELVRKAAALPRVGDSDYLFPAPRGGQLSDMTLTAVLRRLGVDAVPHGFRSTFRDWVAERTNFANEIAEMALAHVIPNAVEAAYRRGDLLEKRRQMMLSWSAFCIRSAHSATVQNFHSRTLLESLTSS